MKLIVYLSFSALFGCAQGESENGEFSTLDSPSDIKPKYLVEKILVHDTTAFTEGLFFFNNELFESTGNLQEIPSTKSGYGILDTNKGILNFKHKYADKTIFGEGAVALNGLIYQITYKSQKGFVFNGRSHNLLKTFTYPNKEGWGLTTNGIDLIMSDGTSVITFLDTNTLTQRRQLFVHQNGIPIDNLNELEMVNGFLFANIFPTNMIAIIDTSSGEVLDKLDFSSLFRSAKEVYHGSMEFNGIAFDSTQQSLFLTGKMWPLLFKVKLLKL